MAEQKPPDPPGTMDVVHAIAKAAVSVVPLAGGPAAELFDLLRIPAAKRQYTWLADVAERLKKLEGEKRLRIEDVVESDAFVSATIRALEAARRTSEDEKRAALRNAVLNVALAKSPDEALTQMFLDWIDRFAGWHLLLLKAFDDPPGWAKAHGVNYRPALSSSLSAFLEASFPELASRPEFYRLLWAELNQAGLTNTGGLAAMMTENGWLASRTSDLGKQFLRFIEEPT